MSVSAGQLGAVRAWLHGQGITAVSDEWLAACLEHVVGSCGAPPLTELRRLVLDQWLDTDLAALAVAALPPRLADQPLVTLRQPCAVQLLVAVDVSQPAHGQLLKIRRVDSSNTEVGEQRAPWEPRPSRALRLTLTDGVQQVVGLECEPLTALSANSPAGLKLLLRPPLECRRGVFLLSPQSVSVLGGAVEELQQPHAEQRELERRLHAAGGPAPGPTDDDSGYRSDRDPPAARDAAEPDPFDDDLDDADLAALEIPDGDEGAGNHAPPAAATAEAEADPSADPFADPFADSGDVSDAEFASLDLDSLVDSAVDRATAREPEPAPAPSAVKRRRTETCDSVRPAPRQAANPGPNGDANGSVRPAPARRQQRLDNFLRSGSLSTSQTPAASKASSKPPSANSAPPSRPVRVASPVREPPSFDLSSWLEPDELEPEPPPPEAPFGYLSQLQPGRPLTVKAFIMTMTSSLDMSGGRYSLSVKINDGTRSADAVLSDAVLTKIIGLTVAESDTLRAAGRTDMAVRTRFRKMLCDAQMDIARLSCLMRLEMGDSDDDLPIITRITEVDGDTVSALRACVDARR